jgi:2-desacetyl-2-hydroxyethyl bacteriochlorophyllide A dehydrogenase
VSTAIPPDAPALVVTQKMKDGAPGAVALERRPVPSPGERELLIRTLFSGVSVGTEMWGNTGYNVSAGWAGSPHVPGYQAVGEVVAVGEGAWQKEGDLIAAFVPNAHQSYQLLDAGLAHNVTMSEHLHLSALFVQPAVGANALNMAGVRCGDNVLVIGQGMIGLCAAMLARMRGAYVVAADVTPERLKYSADNCADEVLDVRSAPVSEQMLERFPDGVDVVIEASGRTSPEEALKCVRRDGKMIFEGFYPDQLSFQFTLAHYKQATAYFPVFIGEAPVREAVLRQIHNRLVDIQPLVSDMVSWKQSADTYYRLFTPERDHLGGIIFDWRDAE